MLQTIKKETNDNYASYSLIYSMKTVIQKAKFSMHPLNWHSSADHINSFPLNVELF